MCPLTLAVDPSWTAPTLPDSGTADDCDLLRPDAADFAIALPIFAKLPEHHYLIYLQHPSILAVANTEVGLLPCCDEAMSLYGQARAALAWVLCARFYPCVTCSHVSYVLSRWSRALAMIV